MKREYFVEIVTISYVILFLYTGISKLIDYTVFKEQIATSPLLAPIAKQVAVILPWAEFTIVIFLTIPRWRLKGLYFSLSAMFVFTSYIIAILSFSKYVPCSCGGIIELLSWKQHLLFNGIFIFLAIWAIILQRRMNRANQIIWSPPLT